MILRLGLFLRQLFQRFIEEQQRIVVSLSRDLEFFQIAWPSQPPPRLPVALRRARSIRMRRIASAAAAKKLRTVGKSRSWDRYP